MSCKGKESVAVVSDNERTTPKSPHKWSPRRKKKRTKRKSARFTTKKVRTTTSNIRVPKKIRTQLYRNRCKQKKILAAKGHNGEMPPINHEDLDANYPVIIQETDDDDKSDHHDETDDYDDETDDYQDCTHSNTNKTPYNLRNRKTNPIKQERQSRKRQRNLDNDDCDDDDGETVSNIKVEDNDIIKTEQVNHNVKTEHIMKPEFIDTSTLPILGVFNAINAINADLKEPTPKRRKLSGDNVIDGIQQSYTQSIDYNQLNMDWNQWNQFCMMNLNRNPINMNLNTMNYANNMGNMAHSLSSHTLFNNNIQYPNSNVNNGLELLASVALLMQNQNNNTNNLR